MNNWDDLFTPKVSRHLWMLARYFDRKNPDDLFQDVITTAFEKLDSFRGGSDDFERWLCQILRFKHFSNHRRGKVFSKKVTRISEFNEFNLRARVEVVDDELSDETLRAMRIISKDDRYLLYMVYVNNFTYGEMSKILKIPLGTVISKIHRIRTRLQKYLSTVSRCADDPDSRTDKTST